MNKAGNYKAIEVCRMFDISKPTLFKWERQGKITKTERDWRGWRIYTQGHLDEIAAIIAGQKLLPLNPAKDFEN